MQMDVTRGHGEHWGTKTDEVNLLALPLYVCVSKCACFGQLVDVDNKKAFLYANKIDNSDC